MAQTFSACTTTSKLFAASPRLTMSLLTLINGYSPFGFITSRPTRLLFLERRDRFILPNATRDSAVIVCPVAKLGKLKLPETAIPLRPIDDRLPIGSEVGWLGFPGLIPTLCFFSGNISAFQESSHAYLIDGVAVDGVSGGPVLFQHPTDGVQIVGSISAYMRSSGETVLGLSVAQDVSHFHAAISFAKTLDEARQKHEAEKREAAAAATAAAEQAGPPPALATPATPTTPADPRSN